MFLSLEVLFVNQYFRRVTSIYCPVFMRANPFQVMSPRRASLLGLCIYCGSPEHVHGKMLNPIWDEQIHLNIMLFETTEINNVDALYPRVRKSHSWMPFRDISSIFCPSHSLNCFRNPDFSLIPPHIYIFSGILTLAIWACTPPAFRAVTAFWAAAGLSKSTKP